MRRLADLEFTLLSADGLPVAGMPVELARRSRSSDTKSSVARESSRRHVLCQRLIRSRRLGALHDAAKLEDVRSPVRFDRERSGDHATSLELFKDTFSRAAMSLGIAA
jgi:hypothetical protein